MHNVTLKNKAKSLRLKGNTVRDIAEELSVSFSTVSFWCRDIRLPDSIIKKMNFQKKERSIKGLLRYSELKREKRIENTALQKEQGKKMIGKLASRDVLMTGLGLYWGEGYKESNGELGFTNSNPKIMKFYIRWLSAAYKIPKSRLIFRLSLNKIFEKQEKSIKFFWTKFLGVNGNQFTKTTFIKTNLKKAFVRKGNEYRGILRVKVRRGLILKNNILGAIEYIANS